MVQLAAMTQLRPMVTPCPDHRIGSDDGAAADLDTGADDHVGPHRHVALEHRRAQIVAPGGDDGARAGRIEHVQHVGEDVVRPVDGDGADAFRHRLAEGRQHDHRAGLRPPQFLDIVGMRRKGQVPAPRQLQLRDTGDHQIRAVEARGEVAPADLSEKRRKRHGAGETVEAGIDHDVT
jgi:hypothetical protein